MKLSKRKIFFQEESSGSRIYDVQNQEYRFFDEKTTAIIKKALSGDYKNNLGFDGLENDSIRKTLLTSDITWIKNKKSAGLSSPQRISINITRKCNLRCKHCLSNAGNPDRNELTTKGLFKLVDQMRNAGSFFMTIGGGEPLLREDLFQVIKYARENFISVSIITNGLLINKEIVKRFNELNLNTITVSIDGLQKNHDRIRGKGKFRKTINKIKMLRKYCKTVKLAMRVTVNSFNVDECGRLIKLAESLSLDLVRLTPMLSLGRAENNQGLLITQNEYVRFLKNTQNLKSKIEVALPGMGDYKKQFICSDNFGCHCGKEACWITQTGDFYPCIFFGDNFLAGNIKNEKLLDIWAKAKNMVKLKGNETCKSCFEYKKCRGGCRARALSIYEDINAVDSLCPLRKNKSIISL